MFSSNLGPLVGYFAWWHSTFAEQCTGTGRLQSIFLSARPYLRWYITSVIERVLFDNSGINQSKLGTGRHEFPQNYNIHWFLLLKGEHSPNDGLSEWGGAFCNSNKILYFYSLLLISYLFICLFIYLLSSSSSLLSLLYLYHCSRVLLLVTVPSIPEGFTNII
jgi:hypothetical protein